MAITLVGTFGGGVDTGSLNLTLPTGISLGDAVGAVVIGSTTPTMAAPAGWTLKSGWPKDGGNARFWLFTKDSVTATDSGAGVTFTPSANTKLIGVGFALHSGNGFPADWTDALNFTAHSTTGTTYTAPSSTSTAAGDWGVAIFGVRGTSPTAWTPAAGLTERQDLQRTGSGATSLHLCDSNGSIGATSTVWGPFTETNISTSNGGALTWLVKENATGGGGGGGGGGGVLYPKVGHYRNHPGDPGWRTRMDLAEAVYGQFQGHWAVYYPSGSVPLDTATTTAITDGKPVHVFWKAYDISWADTSAGNYDTELDAAAADFLALAPRNIWLTIHHEPEDDYISHGSGGVGWTAADYRGMWSRVRSRFNAAGVTNVTWVLAWQHSHSHPAEMITLYGNDGVMDGLVDIVANQDYIRRTNPPSDIATDWLEDLEWLVDNEDTGRHWGYLSKPQAFTEWGSALGGTPADRDTDTHRAQTIDAIRGILPDLAARNVLEVRYFDAGESNYILDPPSVDGVAYQALKDASEAGQAAGPIISGGVALARDGATGTSTTIPFVLPTGWQQGDYATVWLMTNGIPDVTVVPAGWTLQEGPVTTGASNGRAWRYAKALQAGEANPTWTISSAERPSGVMVLLRGVDAATPVIASAALTAVAPSTSLSAAAVTVGNVSGDTYTDTYTEDYGGVEGGTAAVVVTAWLGRWSDASGNGGVNYGTVPGTHLALGSASVNSGANAGAGALVAKLSASPVAPGTYGPYTATFPITTTGITGQIAALPAVLPPPPPTQVFGTATATFGPLVATATGTVTPSGPAPTLIPDPAVLVAFASQPMDPAPVYTTLPGTGTGAVQAPLVITHGRGDEFSEVQPGTLEGALRNEDGRYTMAKTSGPYGSGVKIGRRVRAQYTYQGQLYVRHDGHANGWPTTWPIGGGQVAFGALSSTDRLKRLGQVGALRSMLEEETLRDTPTVYYPLSEGENATSAGSITPTPQAAASESIIGGGGGTIAFGQGTGPGTDELSAAVFTPQSQTSGRLLRANPITLNADTAGVTISCWFNSTARPLPNPQAMVALTSGPGDDAIILGIWQTGTVQMFVVADGQGLFGNQSPTIYADGRTHHAALTLSRSGSTVTARLVIDGVQVQTGTFTRSSLGTFTQLDLGGYHVASDYAPYAGTLSHVAAYPAALSVTRLAVHAQAGLTGLAGERTDQRIARVADWIGLPASDRALDVGDKRMGAQSTAGKQPLEVMREAAQVEQGVLFISPDGKLTFHRLSRRYNRTTPDLTLDCAAEGHVQVGLVMPGDDFGVVNDLEVTRPGGAAQRAINQASINDYGLYRDSLEIPAFSDSDAQAVGNWRTGNWGTPRVRVPNLTVHLSKLHQVSPTLVQAVLGLGISSLVRLTNLPTQAPGTTVDVFVEGWTETIDPAGGWRIELNCSPAEGYTVATVGSALVGSGRVAL